MEINKQGIFNYLEWRGDLKLDADPLNEADGIILSTLSYLDFSFIKDDEYIPIEEAVRIIENTDNYLNFYCPTPIIKKIVTLLKVLSETPRFCSLLIGHFSNVYSEEEQIQFGAVTFILPDGQCFISFRGTDNTLTGWKEDFNMAFIEGTPSQIESEKYTGRVMGFHDRDFIIGGHSKGGNIAIWAAAHQDDALRSRIKKVYAFDSPGFCDNFIHTDMYLDIKPRIEAFVPQSSIVGVLMEHDSDYKIISSMSVSVLQHDPFSWKIKGRNFIYATDRTIFGKQTDIVVNTWIRSMDKGEREEVVESIFNIILSSESKTIDDIGGFIKIKSILNMQKSFTGLGIQKQTKLLSSFSKMFLNRELYRELLGLNKDSDKNISGELPQKSS